MLSRVPVDICLFVLVVYVHYRMIRMMHKNLEQLPIHFEIKQVKWNGERELNGLKPVNIHTNAQISVFQSFMWQKMGEIQMHVVNKNPIYSFRRTSQT